MTRKVWRTAVLAAIAALASTIVACGGGGNGGATTGPSGTLVAGSGAAIAGVVLTQADAETFMRSLADDYNSSNADGFIGKFTNQGLAAFLGDSVTPQAIFAIRPGTLSAAALRSTSRASMASAAPTARRRSTSPRSRGTRLIASSSSWCSRTARRWWMDIPRLRRTSRQEWRASALAPPKRSTTSMQAG